MLQAPSGISKFDPLPHAMRVQAPAARSQSDPFARVLDYFHSRTSAKARARSRAALAQSMCMHNACRSRYGMVGMPM